MEISSIKQRHMKIIPKALSKAGSQQIIDFLRNAMMMHKVNFEHTHYQRLRILCKLSKNYDL